MERDVLNIVARSIVDGTLHVNVPGVVRAFYNLDLSQKVELQHGVNSTWTDLMDTGTFNGGFFVHDLDAVGFTIHQKLRY